MMNRMLVLLLLIPPIISTAGVVNASSMFGLEQTQTALQVRLEESERPQEESPSSEEAEQ